MKQQIWRTTDGRRVSIDKMVTSHIENCIAMIKRGHDAEGRRVTPRTKGVTASARI